MYTIWRTEMAQSRQQSVDYKKSATEWEILGELSERLHHFDEAIEAYQQCLSIRFSPKALKGMLKLYEREGDTRAILGAVIRLIAWQYRWYSEVNIQSLLSTFYLLTMSFSTVFTGITIHDSQIDRRRGRCQSAQHRAGYESSPVSA